MPPTKSRLAYRIHASMPHVMAAFRPHIPDSGIGLTQADLAQRIGRARQWVVRFESGHAGSASVDSLMAVLTALDLYATVDAADDDADSDPIYSWMSSTPGTRRRRNHEAYCESGRASHRLVHPTRRRRRRVGI